MELPEPEILRRIPTSVANVIQVDNSRLKFRHVMWRDLDFTGSRLRHVLFFGGSITNCVFDHCDCENWGLWDCDVARSTFKWADLRDSVLGGVGDAREGCFYVDSDFSGADLRRTIYNVAHFDRCLFRHAKLSKIDFEGSRFVECIFEGELNDVIFNHKGFRSGGFPPNEMVNVDFSHARLRDVGFRGLTLDRVRLPQDSDHIIVKNPTKTLPRIVDALSTEGDSEAKKLIAIINIDLKEAPPNRAQAVISVPDVAEVVGEEGVKRLIALISEHA